VLKGYKFWFITGSQNLYGEDTLRSAAEDSKKIAARLESALPCSVVFKPVVTTPDEITKICVEANSDENCAGIITWMHTFSPSKMWINGLNILKKPLLHLHTQFNRDIPWNSIDMDYMNLNQSAHGDREHGFIGARLRLSRKVVAGHWDSEETISRIDVWMRAAVGACESRRIKVARLGDNMREVAVTEGDKIQAQIKLGWSVNGYGISEFVKLADSVSDAETDSLLKEYGEEYMMNTENTASVREQAKYEIALKRFLSQGGFGAFTDTFEDLVGLRQLPGLASQRIMAAGYGFGPEGDWKTAALIRIFKLMTQDKTGGTSLMEDYTYHMEPGKEAILGAHMLEVCPSIAAGKPRIEVHPLGIGGKEDPARLVFDGKEGGAVCASLIDMGGRFRLIAAQVEAVTPYRDMPLLPVARAMWKPLPDFTTGVESWIYAGGAHHTAFTYDLTVDHLRDFAEIMGIEFVPIDKGTTIESLRHELAVNDIMWNLKELIH
jgi:L-arabinose isomerase